MNECDNCRDKKVVFKGSITGAVSFEDCPVCCKPPLWTEADIPSEVIEAAIIIETYAGEQGWKDWRFMGIADRSLLEKIEEAGHLKKY